MIKYRTGLTVMSYLNKTKIAAAFLFFTLATCFILLLFCVRVGRGFGAEGGVGDEFAVDMLFGKRFCQRAKHCDVYREVDFISFATVFADHLVAFHDDVGGFYFFHGFVSALAGVSALRAVWVMNWKSSTKRFETRFRLTPSPVSVGAWPALK